MSRSLLLADGSVTIQRVMELTFAHEDIRVTAVSDGRKAIQHLDSEQPDVVLVDVDLPEVDGYAVAAHIRRVPRLKGVPVLLLAGAFEPVDQERAREVGSDGVITKPFEPAVVVTRVKELIDQRDRQNASAQLKAQANAAEQPEPSRSAAPPPPPPPAPAPAKPARSETSFPRAAEVPPPLPEMPVVPEPLELPTRPIWDVRGSVATGDAPPEVLPLPAAPPPVPAMPPPAAAAPPPKVTLANAFTALLAAEQSVSPTPSITPSLNEASIEDAVRRVLVRMTDDLVRRIVVDTAERLIREEIERIKSNPE